MVRRCLVAAAVFAMAATASSATRAQDRLIDETFAKQMFGANAPAQGKLHACFVRRFDAAYLAQHPLQKMSALKLLVSAEKDPEEQVLNYRFRVGMKLTDRPGDFASGGDCSHARLEPNPDETAQLGCGVECDGGGISIELSKDAKFTLVRFATLRGLPKLNSEEQGVEIEAGANEPAFRLERASLEECRSLINDEDEEPAMPPS